MRIVRTAPCPKCHSWRTEATIRINRTVLIRVCTACVWAWDAENGAPDGYLQTPAERAAQSVLVAEIKSRFHEQRRLQTAAAQTGEREDR